MAKLTARDKTIRRKQWEIIDKQLQRLGKDRPWLRSKLKAKTNVFTNWQSRGIPPERWPDAARFINCDFWAFQKGEFAPEKPSGGVQAAELDDDLQDILMALNIGGPEARIDVWDALRPHVARAEPAVAPFMKHIPQDQRDSLIRVLQRSKEKPPTT